MSTTNYSSIGLTGGIASGKTTVAELFRSWGAFVADADEISRHALDQGTECYKKTVDSFGRNILNPDGSIDRKRVASIVFSDSAALSILNGIIHPYVLSIIHNVSEISFQEAPQRLIVWDVPLLFEAGYDSEVTKTIVVTSRQDIRIKRIMQRDEYSRAEALRRIRAQMPDREKIKRADIVIRNNGTLYELKNRTKEVFDELLETMGR